MLVSVVQVSQLSLLEIWNNKGKINELDYKQKNHKMLGWDEIPMIILSNLFILCMSKHGIREGKWLKWFA